MLPSCWMSPRAALEKKTDDEGNTTYTLKKEETSTDENGNTVTRTTYYEITGNSVKTRTETTLVLKVEKGTAEGGKDLTTEVKLPSIKDSNDKEILSAEELGDLLKDQTAIDGVYTVRAREKWQDVLSIKSPKLNLLIPLLLSSFMTV